jgi:hypothetical protein
MIDKQALLGQIRSGLTSGIITAADIQSLVPVDVQKAIQPSDIKSTTRHEKLSAVDVMFYVAGLVFFSTIMSSIVQSWGAGSAVSHIALSSGMGIVLWAVVYYLVKSSHQNDVRKGLTNSLLLTGSLLNIVGGYIVINELINGYNEVNYIPGAFALASLAVLHFGFDRLVRRDLTLYMSILLGVGSFPVLIFGLLKDSGLQPDVWAGVVILSAAILAYATRVVAKIMPTRSKVQKAFDPFAVFVALTSMYIPGFGTYGVLWTVMLIFAVFGIFYLSIVTQSKQLLGNATFFLVLSVLTVSFKYFSGYGVTASLVVATIGLLGTAAISASINKKYFRVSSLQQ